MNKGDFDLEHRAFECSSEADVEKLTLDREKAKELRREFLEAKRTATPAKSPAARPVKTPASNKTTRFEDSNSDDGDIDIVIVEQDVDKDEIKIDAIRPKKRSYNRRKMQRSNKKATTVVPQCADINTVSPGTDSKAASEIANLKRQVEEAEEIAELKRKLEEAKRLADQLELNAIKREREHKAELEKRESDWAGTLEDQATAAATMASEKETIIDEMKKRHREELFKAQKSTQDADREIAKGDYQLKAANVKDQKAKTEAATDTQTIHSVLDSDSDGDDKDAYDFGQMRRIHQKTSRRVKTAVEHFHSVSLVQEHQRQCLERAHTRTELLVSNQNSNLLSFVSSQSLQMQANSNTIERLLFINR